MFILIFWFWISPFFSPLLDLGPWLNHVAQPLQGWCIAQVPLGRFSSLTAAMVCGVDPQVDLAGPFLQSGLYHLLVVSGAHLAFLSACLQPCLRIRRGRLLIFVSLFVYALLCGGQPPIIRALIQWLVEQSKQRLRLEPHPFLRTGLAGIITLSLLPSWVDSVSFWLSWLAALSCQWVMTLGLRGLRAALAIHVLLLPALLGLGNADFISVLCNWLFGPILGGVLFPICLLSWMFHGLNPAAEFAWRILISVLQLITTLRSPAETAWSLGHLNFYVALMQLAMWRGWIWWQRQF